MEIPASLSCCNRDLAIFIDFPRVSDIVSSWGMEALFGLKFEMGCQASFRDGVGNSGFF